MSTGTNTERTPLFYMANLGAEVHRYFGFLDKKQVREAQSSKERAFDILRKILDFDSMQSRREEIETLIPVIENPSYLEGTLRETQRQLEDYFMPFSIRAMQV